MKLHKMFWIETQNHEPMTIGTEDGEKTIGFFITPEEMVDLTEQFALEGIVPGPEITVSLDERVGLSLLGMAAVHQKDDPEPILRGVAADQKSREGGRGAQVSLLGTVHPDRYSGQVKQVCRVCGCTEENACEGGCSWANVEKTLCDKCAGHMLALVSHGGPDCIRVCQLCNGSYPAADLHWIDQAQSVCRHCGNKMATAHQKDDPEPVIVTSKYNPHPRPYERKCEKCGALFYLDPFSEAKQEERFCDTCAPRVSEIREEFVQGTVEQAPAILSGPEAAIPPPHGGPGEDQSHA